MLIALVGSIEFGVTKADAFYAAHVGECLAEVSSLVQKKYIKDQLKEISDEELAGSLKPYGAWDEEELKDRGANERRFVWLACWGIVEEEKEND